MLADTLVEILQLSRERVLERVGLGRGEHSSSFASGVDELQPCCLGLPESGRSSTTPVNFEDAPVVQFHVNLRFS